MPENRLQGQPYTNRLSHSTYELATGIRSPFTVGSSLTPNPASRGDTGKTKRTQRRCPSGRSGEREKDAAHLPCVGASSVCLPRHLRASNGGSQRRRIETASPDVCVFIYLILRVASPVRFRAVRRSTRRNLPWQTMVAPSCLVSSMMSSSAMPAWTTSPTTKTSRGGCGILSSGWRIVSLNC